MVKFIIDVLVYAVLIGIGIFVLSCFGIKFSVANYFLGVSVVSIADSLKKFVYTFIL